MPRKEEDVAVEAFKFGQVGEFAVVDEADELPVFQSNIALGLVLKG